ncbi:CDP-diacylglycerol--serine O-phosphatidyltransferase [Belliella pelovolcani]|uniref:CDP-diacylglycerol--serine O-phosphatidyltransferase n=1 Tax=Belliella pelovolcani TaxID=529505 RepID=A0A1N7MHV5_9BACT|nr:CDP-diacylglycerol--serine O-phosphatidyltransferase [Belliella pelovolcani]SIS85764.1 CDP-diacylglycerol---serine O-phosphatidyltransferase [Belliella pelovolcani]
MIKKHIPNTITCLNLLSGMIGIYFVLSGEIHYGLYFIVLAAIFDFLDGFVARMLQVHSEIGKQLDSLADLVTFGVLPSFIFFQWILEISEFSYFPFIAFSMGIFSAIRLAKFNVDTRQSDRFIGVPTPANALLIGSIPFLVDRFPDMEIWLVTPVSLAVIAIIMSLLLVAELPLIALKFKSFDFKSNVFRYLTIGVALICIASLGWAGIPITIISYIALSVVEGMIAKNDQKA